jgi:glutamyl-tRNA synthetase
MKEGAAERLEAARQALADVDPWTQDGVQQALDAVVEQTGAKPGPVFQPIRVAITGTTVSPGIYESVHLLGKERTLARIDRALEHARATAGAGAGDETVP